MILTLMCKPREKNHWVCTTIPRYGGANPGIFWVRLVSRLSTWHWYSQGLHARTQVRWCKPRVSKPWVCTSESASGIVLKNLRTGWPGDNWLSVAGFWLRRLKRQLGLHNNHRTIGQWQMLQMQGRLQMEESVHKHGRMPSQGHWPILFWFVF